MAIKNQAIFIGLLLPVLLLLCMAIYAGFFKDFAFKIKYGSYSFFGTKEKMNAINVESIAKSKKDRTNVTVVIHGAGAEYYKDVYGTVIWLKEQGMNPISFDYDFRESPDVSAGRLKKFIEETLLETGNEKVDILGICLGGMLAKYYAQEYGGASSIRKLVTIISPALVIPEKEPAYIYDKYFSFDPDPWNEILVKLENINPVVDHLYLYCRKDLLVPSKYQRAEIGNYFGFDCGHAFINTNPQLLQKAGEFLETRK